MAKIKIKKSRSVPYLLRIIGTVALTALFGYLLDHLDETTFIPAAVACSPILPLLWMSVQILEINDDEKYWWKYHWILGYKWGEKKQYPAIEKMSLKMIMVKPKRKPEEPRYELFIHFTDGESVLLTRRKNLDPLVKNAQKMADKVACILEEDIN